MSGKSYTRLDHSRKWQERVVTDQTEVRATLAPGSEHASGLRDHEVYIIARDIFGEEIARCDVRVWVPDGGDFSLCDRPTDETTARKIAEVALASLREGITSMEWVRDLRAAVREVSHGPAPEAKSASVPLRDLSPADRHRIDVLDYGGRQGSGETTLYVLVDPELHDGGCAWSAGRYLAPGSKYRVVHVISRPAGGECRGYIYTPTDNVLMVREVRRRDWPELDQAMARLFSVQVTYPPYDEHGCRA